jgi:hypothetical protein
MALQIVDGSKKSTFEDASFESLPNVTRIAGRRISGGPGGSSEMCNCFSMMLSFLCATQNRYLLRPISIGLRTVLRSGGAETK